MGFTPWTPCYAFDARVMLARSGYRGVPPGCDDIVHQQSYTWYLPLSSKEHIASRAAQSIQKACFSAQEAFFREESSLLTRTDESLHQQTTALREEGARLFRQHAVLNADAARPAILAFVLCRYWRPWGCPGDNLAV